MSAEVAVTLPTIALVLAACLAGLQRGRLQVRLQDAAADAARMLARGESFAAAAGLAGSRVPGSRASSSAGPHGVVCVRLSAPAGRLPLLRDVELSADSCALQAGR